MKILAVPNWSFFNPELCAEGVARLSGVQIHYAQGDVDHHRTVTAFSGEAANVFSGVERLAEVFLPFIDLKLSRGVHPRVGALDVAPFVLIEGSISELVGMTRAFASHFCDRFEIPVNLYEMAAFPGKERRLPVLRGQTGAVRVAYDFGSITNARSGYSVIGVRDFLLAANYNFMPMMLPRVREAARKIRELRETGDPQFFGVRALAFDLPSRGKAQLSLNMTAPDSTSFDEISKWVIDQIGTEYDAELIGVIRSIDLLRSTMLSIDPAQIVR